MKILLDAYFDRNFGDDMMIRITAHELKNHELYLMCPKNELMLPFAGLDNIFSANDYTGRYDAKLRVTGSGFIVRRKMDALDLLLRINKTKKTFGYLPSAVIGCNIDPFSGKLQEYAVKRQLSLYDLITTRDTASEKYINNSVKRKTVACYPDIVFATPDEWLPESTNEALGICAYRKRGSNNLMLYRKLAYAADYYIEKYNKKVLIFAFDIENENDLSAAYTVRSLSKHSEMTEIIAHTDNGDNIISGLSRCEKIIAIRFHSMVMSLRMEIPFLPLCYSDKSANMLSDIGYDRKAYKVDEISKEEIIDFLENKEQPFVLPKEIFETAQLHFQLFEEEILKHRR